MTWDGCGPSCCRWRPGERDSPRSLCTWRKWPEGTQGRPRRHVLFSVSEVPSAPGLGAGRSHRLVPSVSLSSPPWSPRTSAPPGVGQPRPSLGHVRTPGVRRWVAAHLQPCARGPRRLSGEEHSDDPAARVPPWPWSPHRLPGRSAAACRGDPRLQGLSPRGLSRAGCASSWGSRNHSGRGDTSGTACPLLGPGGLRAARPTSCLPTWAQCVCPCVRVSHVGCARCSGRCHRGLRVTCCHALFAWHGQMSYLSLSLGNPLRTRTGVSLLLK